MKINALEMMRSIRDKVDSEIKNLSWEEESKYLKEHSKYFVYLTEKTPNKALHTDGNSATLHCRR